MLLTRGFVALVYLSVNDSEVWVRSKSPVASSRTGSPFASNSGTYTVQLNDASTPAVVPTMVPGKLTDRSLSGWLKGPDVEGKFVVCAPPTTAPAAIN